MLLAAAANNNVIVAILGIVVGPIGAYLLAARRFSGKVQTSEASDLWRESAAIRDWSSDQMKADRARIAALEGRVGSLEAGNDALFQENVRLTREVQTLNTTIAALRTEIIELTNELAAERRRNAELEGKK